MISNVFETELIFLMFLLVLPCDELAFVGSIEATFMRVESLVSFVCSLDTFAPEFIVLLRVGAV